MKMRVAVESGDWRATNKAVKKRGKRERERVDEE